MTKAPNHYLPNAKLSGVRPARFDPVQYATGVRCTIHDSEGNEQVISAVNREGPSAHGPMIPARDSDLFGIVEDMRVEHTRVQRGTLTLIRFYVRWPSGAKHWHDSADLVELT